MIRTEQIVTRYTADTKSAVVAFKQLQDAQAGAGKAMDGASVAGQKFLGMLDKLAAIAAPVAAVKLLSSSLNELAEYQTLNARASTYAVEKIIKGTRGMVTEMDAMRMAAKLAGKVTSDQMETAAKAAFALSQEGFDLKETFEKLTQSILKGKAQGLDDLGLKFREAKTEGEKFNAMMEALGAKAKEGEAATLGSAESVQKLGVDMQNSMDRIKRSIGEVVVAMEPLIDLVADLAMLAAKLVSTVAGWASGAHVRKLTSDEQLKVDAKLGAGDKRPRWMIEADVRSADTAPAFEALGISEDYGAAGSSRASVRESNQRVLEAIAARKARRGSGRRGPTFEDLNGVTDAAGEAAAQLAAMLGGIGNTAGALPTTLFSQTLGASAPWSPAEHDPYSLMPMLSAQASQLAAEINAANERTVLETFLGPIEEINAYTTAFGMLTGAVTSALTAWIDGSMSAGEAVKRFFADSLKGLAVDAATRALWHGAAAIGYLATGNPAGATTHGKAAAAYAAVAVAAAAGARSLHGSAPASVGGGGAGTGTGAGSSGGGVTTTIISYGDHFADDSHRMRQQRARRMVALAGNMSTRDAVRYE